MESTSRYALPLITLHWVVAVLILVLLVLGWYMVGIPRGTPPRGYFFNLHKSIGIVAGLFIALQIWWRTRRRPPPLPAELPAWQRRATRIGHALLYICMAAVVLTGYVESNFTKFGVRFFGYQLQPWGWEDPAISGVLRAIHLYSTYVLAAIVVGHVGAAMHHLLIRKDRIVDRMLPGH